ncbi:MAG TPA: nuclear transport factor 2 family protein, partial [Blastocatellia bacterium]|nr:nuclear transport factor 2 family protein [Blastocatellia bacterium]
FITLLIAGGAFAEDRERDHEQLRAMLRTATEAMNSRNFDALTPLFHSKFSITTVDQKLFTNLADFRAYYEGLYNGANAPLKNIVFKPEADALTEFVGDNIGLSHGTSTDTYTFSDGDTRVMTSRWTATVFKDDGGWKIINLHIGANLFDNPVVSSLKSYVYKAGIGTGIGGLIVGFALAWLLKGKRRK